MKAGAGAPDGSFMHRFTGHDLTCIRGERTVFTGLGFAVTSGGALVLTGPNGSGKSSLLRLMAGLLHPAAGAVAWNGESTAEDPDAHRERLLYVSHQDAVKPALTVGENLGFWAALTISPRGQGDVVGPALQAFGIDHLAEVPARYLSAGQKRRLTLARLVATPAALWLLDEPTTALDTDAVVRLRRVIEHHRADGGLVVVSTHADLDLADARSLDLGAAQASARAPS
jgi:heme exporter protein A